MPTSPRPNRFDRAHKLEGDIVPELMKEFHEITAQSEKEFIELQQKQEAQMKAFLRKVAKHAGIVTNVTDYELGLDFNYEDYKLLFLLEWDCPGKPPLKTLEKAKAQKV